MKELRIPVPQDDIVDVSEIDSLYSGIILCYKGDKATGFIYHGYDTWYYNINLDVEEGEDSDDTLIALIKRLVSNKRCDRFKVISFE